MGISFAGDFAIARPFVDSHRPKCYSNPMLRQAAGLGPIGDRSVRSPFRGQACLVALLAAGALCACRTPAASAPTLGAAGTAGAVIFMEVAAKTGLSFQHVSGMAGDMTLLEMMGPGSALLDYDNDGDLDVYLLQGHALPRAGAGADAQVLPPPAAAPLDRLYRNDLKVLPDGSRELQFTDVTAASGIRAPGYGMGAATGDFNNDGWIDLYVSNWGSNQLWRNNGDGTFSDVTAASGTDDPRWSSSAAFVDYDRDGWLDLISVGYVDFTLAKHRPCISSTANRVDYCGPLSYGATPSRLFHNRGDGTFEDDSAQMGLATEYGAGLGVVASDLDLDGWPDLYVANDGSENQLWTNQAGKAFVNEARARGAALNREGLPEAGMGVVAGDLNGDGLEDLFITHLVRETNTLYVGDPSGVFNDATRSSGLGQPSYAFTSFGVADIDYDNDGWPDLAVTNGDVHVMPGQVYAAGAPPLRMANQLFHNVGAGRFVDVSAHAGAAYVAPAIGRGMAMGDIDNDGDSDLLVNNNEGPARLYLNEVGAASPWLGVRLVAGTPPRDQIGARVELRRDQGLVLLRRGHTDGSYLSASDPRVLFGLGDQPGYRAVRVRWPSGEIEEWADLDSGQYHTLIKGEGRAVANP